MRVRLVREKERVAWGELVAIERSGPRPRRAAVSACSAAAAAASGSTSRWRRSAPPRRPSSSGRWEIAIGPVRAAGPEFGYRDRAQLAVGADAGPASRPVGGGVPGAAVESRSSTCPPVRCSRPRWRRRCPRCARSARGCRPAPRSIFRPAPRGSTSTSPTSTPPAPRSPGASRIAWRRAGSWVWRWRADPALGRSEVNVSEARRLAAAGPGGRLRAGGRRRQRRPGGGRAGGRRRVRPASVLELYAGSGNFTRHLVARATRVLSPATPTRRPSSAGARAVPAATWSGRIPEVSADVVLIDPPREGADASPSRRGATRARGASSTSPAIPRRWRATRGGSPPRAFGWRSAVALDLMPQTFHVEVVAIFERSVRACTPGLNPTDARVRQSMRSRLNLAAFRGTMSR